MTRYTPIEIPSGRVELNGIEMIGTADGGLIPVSAVKPQHLLEDDLVRGEIGHAWALSDQLTRFLGHFVENLTAYEELVAERYGARVGGKKGNKTLMTYDGLFKVQVQVADNVVFGPELQIAKTLVDECLTDWSAGAGDELKAVIARAFNTDKEGQINRAALYSLLRLEIADTPLAERHAGDPRCHARGGVKVLRPLLSPPHRRCRMAGDHHRSGKGGCLMTGLLILIAAVIARSEVWATVALIVGGLTLVAMILAAYARVGLWLWGA